MPKQTLSIPNDVLWARLGDRSLLSDELWLIAAQVGMLLGRSTDQLSEDRKVGNPPPFKKDGGSIRYRLGSVRDHMFNLPEFSNTTEARILGGKPLVGFISNFESWKDNVRSNELWPFLIDENGQVIEFWESLSLSDRLRDSDRCEWLSKDDYFIETSPPVVMRNEFLRFLRELYSRRFENPTPSVIADLTCGKIFDSLHLVWIREILNGTIEEKHSLGGERGMGTLTEILQCKSLSWNISEGIYRLLDENPVMLTKTAQLRQGEIQGYITAAINAAHYGSLPCKAGLNGEIGVKAIDLLNWAKDNQLPVDPKIEGLIKGKGIGGINPRQKPGRPVDPAADLRGKIWRKFAHQKRSSCPDLSISDITKMISKDSSLNHGRHTEATIHKQLSMPRMVKDGYWKH